MRLSVSVLLCGLLALSTLHSQAQQQSSSYGFLNVSGRANKQNALISWETIQELTITRFRVQQSRTGIDFSTVGSVEALHDSTLNHQYSFTDHNVGLAGQVVYYRLAMDIDNGRTVYSKTFLLRFDESGEARLSIFPNVVAGTLPLLLEGTDEGSAELAIVDPQGRVLQRQTLALVKGSSSQTVNISGLRPGNYIAVVSTPGLRLQQRFFHQ